MYSPEFEAAALDEALSDYFAARHRGGSCIGEGVKFSAPCRDINSDSTLQQRYENEEGCGIFWHCVGRAFSSALWRTTLNLPPAGGDETDQATYYGLRYYMTPVMYLWWGHEAVIRAAKDREHNNQRLYPIIAELQTQFFNRGLGFAHVTTSLAEATCGQWTLAVTGSEPRNFQLVFQSGSGGLHQDGSVITTTDSVVLGTFNGPTLPASFSSSQVGGHSGSDGHWHAMRLRFTATAEAVGWLDYYAGHGPFCGPFVVSASAPSYVTVKTTYPLTGSANAAGSGWLWERSYNGGTYSTWSTQQNSSFFASAGQYTLGWRLSATRTYDGARDTAWASTIVCIPPGGGCGAVRLAADAPGRPDSSAAGGPAHVVGDHFGSGLWIALPDGAPKRLIRMYSPGGWHDATTTTAAAWPNILEWDGGDWTYATPPGTLTLAARRHPAGEQRSLLHVTGRLTGAAHVRTLTLGLSADPDLGAAEDDALGFDPQIGVVWVVDRASGRHVAYLPLATTVPPRVQQFEPGPHEEPESAAAALRLMAAPTRISAGDVGDVRFLLVVPDVAVNQESRFEATLAVLRTASEPALLELARATQRDAATLLAALPGRTPTAPVRAFALRQSLGTSSLSAAAPGSGSDGAQASVARLQAEGITALDYSVPTGQGVAVRIRLYNSRGQLVRVLVDEQHAGGSYHVAWDRLNERGQRVSPGVYVAVMEAGGFRATRKLVVTR
jgi:hypothetical protein